MEGARLRRKPVKKSKVIKRLSFGEPVKDLGKKSKRPMKGRLQCQEKRARWKKVKTKDGKKGWLWAPLLAKQAPVQGEDWKAVVAFRGRAESDINAWGDLIGAARAACESNKVHFHLATRKKSCVKVKSGSKPPSTIDMKAPLAKQGHGWILKARGQPATYLNFASNNLSKVLKFCGAPAKPAPAFASPKSGRLLLSMSPSQWLCAWNVHNLESGQTRTIFQTEKCPSSITFSKDKVIYMIDKKLHQLSWSSDAKPQATPLPQTPQEEAITVRWTPPWISQKSGRLRIGYHAIAKTEKTANGIRFKRNGSAIEVKKNKDNFLAYYLKDGKAHPSDPGGGKAIEMPSWGAEHWAMVFEWSGGAWKEIAAAPTMCEAGDAPCMKVLSHLMKADKSAINAADARVYCGGSAQECFASKPISGRSDLIKLLGVVEEDNDAVGYLKAQGGHGYLFKMEFGDSPHAMGPVYACKDDCRSRTKLENVTKAQLTVDPQGGFVLVADEYANTNPKIFALGKRKPMFTPKGWAAWLPPSPLWKKLK